MTAVSIVRRRARHAAGQDHQYESTSAGSTSGWPEPQPVTLRADDPWVRAQSARDEGVLLRTNLDQGSGDLSLAYFLERLAIDTQLGGEASFQTGDSDFNTTAFAVAIFLVIDAALRLIDFLDQFAFAIARAQLQTELLLLGGAIVGIREVGRVVFHVVDRTIDLFHELLLPLRQ